MLNFRKLENTITGAVNGKPFNITRTDEAIAFLTDAQTNDFEDAKIWEFLEKSRLGEVAGTNKYLIYSPVTKEYFLTIDGFRSKKAIPQVLVDIIEESHDKDIDFMPILKAWARLLTNPRYTHTMGEYFATYIGSTFTNREDAQKLMDEQDLDEDIALNMSTYQDISISKEGLLVTYKVADIVDWEYLMVADEDGNYTKTMKNKYKKIPAKLDPTTGDVLSPETYEKPEHLEDYLFTPAIWDCGDQFYSGDKLGYTYKVGEVQKLPKDATQSIQFVLL